jgi:hypothetical protein
VGGGGGGQEEEEEEEEVYSKQPDEWRGRRRLSANISPSREAPSFGGVLSSVTWLSATISPFREAHCFGGGFREAHCFGGFMSMSSVRKSPRLRSNLSFLRTDRLETVVCILLRIWHTWILLLWHMTHMYPAPQSLTNW